MLDRRGKLDDHMIQSSWLDMKSILDHEMPVKKDRKGLLFFIFFLAAVLATGYWMNSQMTDGTKDKKESLDQGIVEFDLKRRLNNFPTVVWLFCSGS